MANNCYYEMYLVGSKNSCEEWVKRMESYDEPNHFYRIFSCQVYESEYIDKAKDKYMMKICGDCAWSLDSCCRASEYSNGIDLFAVNTKELSLRMEVFSEESGMCFQEHYIYDNGICKADECVDYFETYYNSDDWDENEDGFAEFKKAHNLPEDLSEEELEDGVIYKEGGFGEWSFSIC